MVNWVGNFSSPLNDEYKYDLLIMFIGIAYVGSACNTENGKAVALVRDEGGFKGITTAAHELAHT